MKAVHFGAGNIGRGFIGEVLYENGAEITFVDVNDVLIDALKEKHEYTIVLADETQEELTIQRVTGLNSLSEQKEVMKAIAQADIITTAIGPHILPKIAELIADGIAERQIEGINVPLDIIACENMIGGSTYLGVEVSRYIEEKTYFTEYIGFPDAAVDRIVPQQTHQDILKVEVEPFREWVVAKNKMKNPKLMLNDVLYVENLEPYIERKLFTVNTGHATVAYTGALLGYQTIDEAMEDSLVVAQLKSVLSETGKLLINKWNFEPSVHQDYILKTINRFENSYISDSIARVARTPIRKLGYDERFIRPLLELKKMNIYSPHLNATVGMIFNYYDPNDEQSEKLHYLMDHEDINYVIEEVTGIKDDQTLATIKRNVERYARNVA